MESMMRYYLYSVPGCPHPHTLNTSEHPDSVRSRFRFGEANLTRVPYEVYLLRLRENFRRYG